MKNVSVRRLAILCCTVYFISHVARYDYTASLTAIMQDLELSKQTASIAVTSGFIAIWLGQFIAGALGDRIKPRYLITVGMSATGLINLIMVFLNNIFVMTVLWTLNGLFQALIWPPMAKIMTDNMNTRQYAKTALGVSMASASSNIAVYLLAPAAIAISGWRLVFVIAAASALGIALAWAFGTRGVKENTAQPKPAEKTEKTENADGVSMGKLILLSGLIPIMLAAVMSGALRDGVTAWVPTYIFEVYDLSVSLSILSSALLPVFGIFGTLAASALLRKTGNSMMGCFILSAISFAALAVMVPFSAHSLIICVSMLALLTGCMYGIIHLLSAQMPSSFYRYGKTAMAAGLLTAAIYAGSTISTYGFAALSELFGWQITIAIWTGMALVCAILCILTAKQWKKFTRGKE